MATKKQSERQYLEIVRLSIDDFPNGTIEESEQPDFLVRSKDHVLGIELTRIFNHGDPGSAPPQSQDRERDRVVEKAQAIAKYRGMRPLWVDVYFDPNQIIGKRDRGAIAESLVDLVSGHFPRVDERLTLENRHPLSAQFPVQVEAVSAGRFKWLISHLWQTADAGQVSEDFAPQLQHIIAEKNARLPAYRRQCGECWLVVVADWLGPSAFFEMSDSMRGACHRMDFDRVYFVESHSGRVVLVEGATNVG